MTRILVSRSRPESNRSYPESFEVVPDLNSVDENRSRWRSTGAIQCNVFVIWNFISLCFFCLSICACTSYISLCFERRLRSTPADSRRLLLQPITDDSHVSERLQTTPDNFDSGRLQSSPNDSERFWTTPNDSERFSTIPDDSQRLPTIPDDSEQFRIKQGGTTIRSRLQILPTLSITSSGSCTNIICIISNISTRGPQAMHVIH